MNYQYTRPIECLGSKHKIFMLLKHGSIYFPGARSAQHLFAFYRCLWPTVAMSVSTTDLARAWEKDDVVRSNARKHQAVPRKNFDLFGGSYIMFFQNHSLRCVSTVLEYHTWATWGLETMGPFAQVKAEGNLVTRGALVTNEMMLTHAIQHVGSRVSVDVLYLHLSSLYEFVECPMQSSTVGISTFVFSTPGQPFMQHISVFFRVTLSTGIDNIYC